MHVQPFAVEALGNTAYLLLLPELGEAVTIDPPRDVDALLAAVEAESLRLSWALETHVHNDFVSGCRELVSEAGARLGASTDADLRYPFERLRNGQEIALGPYRLRVLATPGHTPEHVSYLLLDETGRALKVFSGGSLMVGTAARPDLLGPAESWRLAAAQRQSLHEQLLALPEEVQVLPTHGGGSFCAAGTGGEQITTIGHERTGNPLALAPDEVEYIALALSQGPYPSYFDRLRQLNQVGAPLLGRHLPVPSRLAPDEFHAWGDRGAAMLDLRPAASFAKGHLPDSYAIGLEGNHSAWVGWLLPRERPLLLIADDDTQVLESVRQLARIGFDRVVGVLDGGVHAWAESGRPLNQFGWWKSSELGRRLLDGERIIVVDVRERHEWFSGHIPGSVNLPPHDIRMQVGSMPTGEEVAVHCSHHFRGTLGASLLEQVGYRQLTVIEDGFDGWAARYGTAGVSR